ncbi:c-type cytochrome [Flavobacterium cellulosilyticum]|uniref:Cytochrome c n=1 Tax=Flavobacterium cellulosilyticum TaxID=2541731 RepID=A0A4R5CIU7_9FLAO|nr:cytochrome c [Flavobacterium cellulosilyticum]
MKKYIIGIALIALALQSFKRASSDSTWNESISSPYQVSMQPQANNGKTIYNKVCMSCHQMNGTGIPGAFPPLAKSDYLNADVNRAIKQILNGSLGAITVNGKKYTTPMPKQELNDQQIADVLTYVYANWGNNKAVITPEMVKKMR